MTMINQDYLYSIKYSNPDDFFLPCNSIFFFGYSVEDRSHSLLDALKNKCHTANFIEIKSIHDEKDVIVDGNTGLKYYLRNTESIQSLIRKYNASVVYIDVSGLNNRISASLLKNAILLNEKQSLEINVIYVEPYTYQVQQFKSEGVFNDLSEKIEGIDPLPGFANIIPYTDEIKFVVLLGFEGGRFTYLKECIQPPDDSIIPVIGVPGFRIEYPFVALWGNRLPLDETKSWNRIEYISANSIVDAYFILKKIMSKIPKNGRIVVAPIGTKPHAIGAILFAIKFPNRVEIVYDNPIRKINRTNGAGQIIVCHVNSLLSEP
jgi:hypothetical protein